MVIIDAWMQHPSAEFLADPMFDSLRRWAGGRLDGGEVPVAETVAAMDAAGVRTGMLCAWWGPRGPLISNDAVAAVVAGYPGRFAGVAAVDLARPMDAVRELRRCVRDLGFRALRVVRGCGTCHPATAATTRCTPNASSWASRSASRSAMPARCARPSRAGRSPTWTPSRWSSPNWSSWPDTSATRGPRR